LRLFKILKEVIEVIYKLNLLKKMQIYLIQYITILELVYRDTRSLIYKKETYRGQKEDKWDIQKVIDY
jgi:hypothetical protein